MVIRDMIWIEDRFALVAACSTKSANASPNDYKRRRTTAGRRRM